MLCPRCRTDNREGRRFCSRCAAPLAIACASCGFTNDPGDEFCGGCGQRVTGSPVGGRAPDSYTPRHLAEKILTSKSALIGERKQVTVLFADIKDSMELLAERDPEEARALLDPVLEHMMDAVHRYEGTVNQVMGDGILALFGAPLAHEDHAVRACYAALRMQQAVKQHAEGGRRRHGLSVQIRVGLNSGDVLVRAIGSDLRMDYTAIGQTTHLAARMEQLAAPGSIVLGPATLELVEGYVEVNPLGPRAVKGLAEPVGVYELVGAGAVRSRLQAASARGLTRFVGRAGELVQLHQALERARAGHGQVVAVLGDPGVGKSRLAYEVTHSPRTDGWLVLETAAVSYGQGMSYWPVIGLLKGYFALQDQDGLEEIRDKVTDKLRALDPSLRSAVLALLDVPVDDASWQTLEPAQLRQHTLDAVKRLLLREARERALLLLVEDLHWIDAESQALLDGLIESLPGARLLLLVTYRHEYQHGWGQKSYYTRLRLDPLPPAGADELLHILLGDHPSLAPLRRLLIERAEGNPFFLEEGVRALVETRVLGGGRGEYYLAKDTATLQIPATVQAVLAARIDRLSPEERHLLQTAAVIGVDVPFALLRDIAELPEEAVSAGLARLQATEFLYEAELFPELEYAFAHTLTHEVTYGGLLQERRRELHARTVAAIEARYPDRLAEHVKELAVHAVRGEVWDKALHYCQQVGVKDFDRRAYRGAATAYEQALEAHGHFPESLDTGVSAVALRRDLAEALINAGEHQRALAVLGEAATRARRLDDQAALGRVLPLMGFARRLHGDLEGAIAAGREGLEIAAALGDPVEQANASYRLAGAFHSVGDLEPAAELLRRNVETLALDTPGRIRELAISSRAWLGRVLSERGEFRESRRHGEEALRLAMEERRGLIPLIAYGSLGLVYLNQGHLEEAIRVLEAGRAFGHTSDDRDWSENIASTLGRAYGMAGRFPESLALQEKVLKAALQRRALFIEPGRAITLGMIYRLAGRLQEAWPLESRALDLARQQKARRHEANALTELGALCAEATPPDVQGAEAHYREALALVEPRGMRPLVAHCHLGLGKLYRRHGKREEAQEHLTTATTLYREMDMPFWLEDAEMEMKEGG